MATRRNGVGDRAPREGRAAQRHREVDLEVASFLANAARREHALADLCRERLNIELPSPPMDTRKRLTIAQAMPDEVAQPFAGASVHAIAVTGAVRRG